MSRKLRIFISSTMKDLPNERRGIFRKLESYNFEPVMAEHLPASEMGSWETIREEIRSCDILVLVLGEKYGWIPKKGPKAERKASVTRLELEEAQAIGMPILPFLKKLNTKAKNRSRDARERDKFREAIKDWKDGHFVSREFGSPRNLANQVGEAVISLLTKRFSRKQMADRAPSVDEYVSRSGQSAVADLDALPLHLPSRLVKAVAERKAVLFAGAGFSLSAGLPSASAFAERLTQVIREKEPGYLRDTIGSGLAGIATDLETLRGKDQLVSAVLSLTSLPHIKPTLAHRKAVSMFDHVITTNYDALFEKVAAGKDKRPVIFEELDIKRIPTGAVLKLHGSVRAPDSLILTERDLLMLDKERPNLWNAALALLRNNLVIVVGSSLRDPSLIRLFTEAGDQVSGFFVAPYLAPGTRERLSMWSLECIAAGADSFFNTLANALMKK